MLFRKRGSALKAWREFRNVMRDHDGSRALLLIGLAIYAGVVLAWGGIIALIVLSVVTANHVAQVAAGVWVLAAAASMAWQLRRYKDRSRRDKAGWLILAPVVPLIAGRDASEAYRDRKKPLVALHASRSELQPGEPLELQATVARRRRAAEPTGTVQFFDRFGPGARPRLLLGTAPVIGGQATITTSALAPGSYSLAAVYSGDSSYQQNTGRCHASVSYPRRPRPPRNPRTWRLQ